MGATEAAHKVLDCTCFVLTRPKARVAAKRRAVIRFVVSEAVSTVIQKAVIITTSAPQYFRKNWEYLSRIE
jgi:hypothetical protein